MTLPGVWPGLMRVGLLQLPNTVLLMDFRIDNSSMLHLLLFGRFFRILCLICGASPVYA